MIVLACLTLNAVRGGGGTWGGIGAGFFADARAFYGAANGGETPSWAQQTLSASVAVVIVLARSAKVAGGAAEQSPRLDGAVGPGTSTRPVHGGFSRIGLIAGEVAFVLVAHARAFGFGAALLASLK